MPRRARTARTLDVSIFYVIGRLTQRLECYPHTVEVTGSNPVAPTRRKSHKCNSLWLFSFPKPCPRAARRRAARRGSFLLRPRQRQLNLDVAQAIEAPVIG